MEKKALFRSFGFLLFISLTGCYYPYFEMNERQQVIDTTRVIGYVPVYGTPDNKDIVTTSARNIADPGKIYVYGKYLLVNEKGKGIHVFDNSNPAEPVNLGFLQLLGNTDMAIKDGLLYADHMGNLVALSVNDFRNIEEKGRLPLTNWNFGLPPPAGFSYECVQPEKGLVISWKEERLLNPDCYAF